MSSRRSVGHWMEDCGMKERYELSLFFFIEGMPQATHAFADMKIPLKRRKDADDWIDSSVKKAILVDKTNNQITLLKDE